MRNRGSQREQWEPSQQNRPTSSDRQAMHHQEGNSVRNGDWRDTGRGWRSTDRRYNDAYHYESSDYRRVYYSNSHRYGPSGPPTFQAPRQSDFYDNYYGGYSSFPQDGFVDFRFPPPTGGRDRFLGRRNFDDERNADGRDHQGIVEDQGSANRPACSSRTPAEDRAPDQLFFIDPSPSPAIETKKKKSGKKKRVDKQQKEKEKSEVTQEEEERAQKLKMIRKLAQKRFKNDSSSSTVPNLPTEQLSLLERIANLNIPLSGKPSQSSNSARHKAGIDEEVTVGVLGAELETTEHNEEDNEIEIVIPSPKTPPPVIDLDEIALEDSNNTSESQVPQPIPPEPGPSSSGDQIEDDSPPTDSPARSRPSETASCEPLTARRDSEAARTISTSADDQDSQDDSEDMGNRSDTRRTRRNGMNPFLLANNIYTSDGSCEFNKARRLYSRCEQMNSLLDNLHTLQEEQSSVDLEIRALCRRREHLQRQIMTTIRRFAIIGNGFPEELMEKKRNQVELKEVGTDALDLASTEVEGSGQEQNLQDEVPAAIISVPVANSAVNEALDPGRPECAPRETEVVFAAPVVETTKEEQPAVKGEETPVTDSPADPLETGRDSGDGSCANTVVQEQMNPNLINVLLTIKEEVFDQDEYNENHNGVVSQPESWHNPLEVSPSASSEPSKKRKLSSEDGQLTASQKPDKDKEPKQKKKKSGPPKTDSPKQLAGKKDNRKQEVVKFLQKLTEKSYVELGQHNGSCMDLAVANDYLVTCSQDRSINVYSLSTNHLIRIISGKHGGSISQVLLVDPDDHIRGKNLSIFTACMDNCFREFCLQTGRLHYLSDYHSAIQSMTRENGNFYLGCHNGEVHHYRSNKHRMSKLKLRVEDAVTCLKTCSLNGVKCLLVGVKNRGVILADANTGNEVRRFANNEASVMGLCTLDQTVFAADSARNVVAYNLADGKQLAVHRRRKGCICLVEHKGYIFVAGLGSSIDVFDRKLSHKCSIPVYQNAVIFSLDVEKDKLYVGDRAGTFGYYPLPLM